MNEQHIKLGLKPNYLGLNYFKGFFLLPSCNGLIICEVLESKKSMPKHSNTQIYVFVKLITSLAFHKNKCAKTPFTFYRP